MRWFKHMTASGNDEKLSRLKDKFGLEGYGFWWAVLEIVAEKVGEDAQTSAEFSLKKWGSLVGVSPKKFRTLAEFCANLELFSLTLHENILKISFDNGLRVYDRELPSTWSEIRKNVFKRDKYICQYCGTKNGPFECDHIFPRILGGSDRFENLTTACRHCNRSKGSKILEEWLQ